jgi:hypothetical protein
MFFPMLVWMIFGGFLSDDLHCVRAAHDTMGFGYYCEVKQSPVRSRSGQR